MSVVIVAIILFAFGLFAEVGGGKPLPIDHSIMLALRNSADPSIPIGPPWLREAARDITSLGSTIVLGIITFAVESYVLLARDPAVAWLIIIAVIGGLGLNNILKLAFARPRPTFMAHTVRLHTTSFPSGHAAMSAITYLTIGTVLAQTHPGFAASLCLISLAAFLTMFIGISRIYLGFHYPTDILGGWCVGAAWAIFCWHAMAWLSMRN
jgi:undecaprenyl-diphosphatase